MFAQHFVNTVKEKNWTEKNKITISRDHNIFFKK